MNSGTARSPDSALAAASCMQAPRSGDNANRDFRLPGYTTVDALAYYQMTRNIRLNLNVINLFDKEYYDRSVSSVWVSPGTPRTVLGSVAFRF
jgi:iron complex outermembrane receptor protein